MQALLWKLVCWVNRLTSPAGCAAMQAMQIRDAGKELLEFLNDNVGHTADWPIQILADNDQSAKDLAIRLNKLNHSLLPNARPHR